jgi:RimJ/RimL family protein N-acetyltransferase
VLLSGDLSRIRITSNRLVLRSITASDAVESFAEANATIARFMSWNAPASLEDFEVIWRKRLTNMAAGRELSLVILLASTEEFLGRASLHPADDTLLETGLWIKRSAQGFGYGREAVASLIAWAARRFRPSGFLYPVVDENTPSRRLAAALGGEIIGTRRTRKPGDVERRLLLYRIPAPR